MSSIPSSTTDPDRTARSRIRDAAIAEFGAHGVAGTSLKVVAAAAGVSQPLIVHHFGSKQGLRRACDEHVAATIRAQKLEALSQGPQLDPVAALRDATGDRGLLLRYLARTLGDGSPEVTAIVDEMVDDAVEYSEVAVRSGLMKPSRHPRERAVILVLWSLGLLTLHEHMERLLGVSLTGGPEQFGPYLLPVVEMLEKGVMADGMYERMRDALSDGQEPRS